MSATKISDLLPIPEGARKPHAYQVFGLEGGEQDAEKIKTAVQEIYQGLRAAKADTDPKLWTKAAAIVEKARGILSDPRKRAALDERFGVINFDEEPLLEDSASAGADPLAGILPAHDPLANLLPANDPLGAVMPSGNPMAVATRPAPGSAPIGTAPSAPAPSAPVTSAPVTSPAYPHAPVTDPPAPRTAPATSTAPAPQGVVAAGKPIRFSAKKSSRRKRKSSAGLVMFATFMIAMFSIIGVFGYFLFTGGNLSVTKKDGQLSISTSPQQQPAPNVVKPPPVTPARPVPLDPVLGSVPKGPARPDGSLANTDPMNNPNGQMAPPPTPVTPAPMPAPVDPPTPTDPSPTPPETPDTPDTPETTDTPDKPEPPNSETLPVTPGTEGPPTEMTDEMVAQADAAIAAVEQLIQQADWAKMKEAAEKVTEMMLTDQQRPHADALYNLADLATFYRGGIVKGMGTLQTAATFELTEGVPVLVVEATDTEITIRANARNRTYTLDDMPFVLADRLAGFAMSPDKPDNIAARSCYQCISPKSNAEYRQDALTWLEFVNDDLEDVDTKKIAELVKKLFPDD